MKKAHIYFIFVCAFVGKYFVEPGTGREFPSLESVQRHLVGEVHDRRLTLTGHFSNERTRVYEESRTKQVT